MSPRKCTSQLCLISTTARRRGRKTVLKLWRQGSGHFHTDLHELTSLDLGIVMGDSCSCSRMWSFWQRGTTTWPAAVWPRPMRVSTAQSTTSSVLEAVDVAFKSMFVLGLQYPAPAHSSWAFVQKAVYGLSHRFDRIPSKVFELLTDIRKWESEHWIKSKNKTASVCHGH